MRCTSCVYEVLSRVSVCVCVCCCACSCSSSSSFPVPAFPTLRSIGSHPYRRIFRSPFSPALLLPSLSNLLPCAVFDIVLPVPHHQQPRSFLPWKTTSPEKGRGLFCLFCFFRRRRKEPGKREHPHHTHTHTHPHTTAARRKAANQAQRASVSPEPFRQSPGLLHHDLLRYLHLHLLSLFLLLLVTRTSLAIRRTPLSPSLSFRPSIF